MTGDEDATLTIDAGALFPVEMVAPVTMGSSLPSATVSPVLPTPRLSIAAPWILKTPATRADSPF